MQPEEFAKKILASRKAIKVNDELMRGLGYSETRELFAAMGNWGDNTDFNTIPEAADTRVQSYLREFIRSFTE